jgi:uncharacterized protein YheU (UPF0270 family)
MLIPHKYLLPAALQSIVEEFVTRDGTDDTAVEPRIASVLSQLEAGLVELHYDGETKSCNVVPA